MIEHAIPVREYLVGLAARICLSRGMPLETLIRLWEESGLHHLVAEDLVEGIDRLDGNAYASALDEFEGEFSADVANEIGASPAQD